MDHDPRHGQKEARAPGTTDEPLTMTASQVVAGGPRAVFSSLKIGLKEMGLKTAFKTLAAVNQKSGFDCPGCAWPDPENHRSMVEFCENGVKAIAEEATHKRVHQDFFAQNSLKDLKTQSEYWLSQQGRLTHPMILNAGSTHFEPISWDEAFQVISQKIKDSDPERSVFYTSGRTSNEAAFLYQFFVRLLGTNHLPDCSNLCHESSGVGLRETIGSGKGTVLLKDFEAADAIFVIGQNPGTNHPRMLTTLQDAARRGCQIITINPLPEAGMIRFKHPQEIGGWVGKGTALTTHFLQVSINGDVAALKGIMKALFELEDLSGLSDRKPGQGPIDHQFISQFTEGFSEFYENLANESWDVILESSGLQKKELLDVAKAIAGSRNIIFCWAMGLTQHKNAVASIQEIVNLALLGGHIGRPGAGLCPVRGHSNVQGDRTMGIWEAPSQDFLDRLGKEFDFSPPKKPGYHVVAAIQAMHQRKVDVFFALGGNFLSASPDTAYTEESLSRCALNVQVSTKLNRSHLFTGGISIILPCLGRTEKDLQKSVEQFVTVEDSMGIVHSSKGVLPPPSEHCQSEVAIISQLAHHTLGDRGTVDWLEFRDDYGKIRDRISRVIPGFEDFNRRLASHPTFVLPHQARDSRVFATASGKARFTVHPIPKRTLLENQFVLMTIRSHDQYNTTIYGLDDRYRGIRNGRRVVFMNTIDMAHLDLDKSSYVDIVSTFKGKERMVRRFRVVPYDIPRRCLAAYFPETNPLVPIDSYADKSHTPTSKSIVVSLVKQK